MTLRRRWIALVVVAAAAALVPLLPASAVENGRPVDSDEQWVGTLFVNNSFTCSVGVIDPQWALTAAHCTDSFTTSDDAFVAGAGAVGSVASVPQKVDRIVRAASGRDLALLHLRRPLALDSYLLLPDNVPYPFDCGQQCAADIYGWSKAPCEFEAPRCGFADTAQTARVEFNPYLTTQCVDARGKENSICSNAATRHGDSGGPLVYRQDGPRIIGVTSSGGRSMTYSANVIPELDWIRGTMNVGVVVVP